MPINYWMVTSIYHASDLFVNYLDVNKIPIPQADEQMRLLSNAIMRIRNKQDAIA